MNIYNINILRKATLLSLFLSTFNFSILHVYSAGATSFLEFKQLVEKKLHFTRHGIKHQIKPMVDDYSGTNLYEASIDLLHNICLRPELETFINRNKPISFLCTSNYPLLAADLNKSVIERLLLPLKDPGIVENQYIATIEKKSTIYCSESKSEIPYTTINHIICIYRPMELIHKINKYKKFFKIYNIEPTSSVSDIWIVFRNHANGVNFLRALMGQYDPVTTIELLTTPQPSFIITPSCKDINDIFYDSIQISRKRIKTLKVGAECNSTCACGMHLLTDNTPYTKRLNSYFSEIPASSTPNNFYNIYYKK